jgi:hypothetical protein
MPHLSPTTLTADEQRAIRCDTAGRALPLALAAEQAFGPPLDVAARLGYRDCKDSVRNRSRDRSK